MFAPMSAQNIRDLNERFAIPGCLTFEAITGGLPVARVRNAYASATVALHGAHVTAFQPHGQRPVLWMSARSRFEAGAPLRGGIPICWPWFGPHPHDPAVPSHGFARISEWEVAGAEALDDGATRIELKLGDTAASHRLWPWAFDLRLRVRVAADLRVELTMRNTGDQTMTCSSALHSYFAVSDVTAVRVLGLQKCRFLDTVPTPPAEGIQDGPVTVGKETDLVYPDTEAECVLEDPGLARRIRIAKEGSRSTVVWNPWAAKAARMPDFGDDEYPGMLCIETANAETDTRQIAPGGQHRLAAVIRVEPFPAGEN